jgi:hypothetical protein
LRWEDLKAVVELPGGAGRIGTSILQIPDLSFSGIYAAPID